MTDHAMPHCQLEQSSMSRLIELFSMSQDMIQDNHVDRASETLDGTAYHETPSYLSRPPSASDSVSSSFLKSGLTDLLDDSEPMLPFTLPTFSGHSSGSSLFIGQISCR